MLLLLAIQCSVTTHWVFSQDLGFYNLTLSFFFTEMMKSILSSGFNSNRDKVINYLSIS